MIDTKEIAKPIEPTIPAVFAAVTALGASLHRNGTAAQIAAVSNILRALDLLTRDITKIDAANMRFMAVAAMKAAESDGAPYSQRYQDMVHRWYLALGKAFGWTSG